MSTSQRRRSLGSSGGETETRGLPGPAELCARAFAITPGQERLDVHGFHAYPARMHPQVAAAIVRTFAGPGERVLDPFCGSGTILVEAVAAGRRATGVDLNPLAVKLARFKAQVWKAPLAASLPARAEALVVRARTARHGAPKGEQRFFDPHVLKELANLRGELMREPAGLEREGLELVLSSILVKLSRQVSDTRTELVQKHLARGFASRLFVRKAEELATQLTAFAERTSPEAFAANVVQGDARELRGIGASTISLVATSPPYGGVFDYISHHERRARWFGLDLSPLERGEIGARRARGSGTFASQIEQALRVIARTLRPGGRAAIVTENDLIERAAPSAGLRFVAAATQRRTVTKYEHLMLFEKP